MIFTLETEFWSWRCVLTREVVEAELDTKIRKGVHKEGVSFLPVLPEQSFQHHHDQEM